MSGDDPIDVLLASQPCEPAAMRSALAGLHALLPVRGDPVTPADLLALLRLLYRIARRDLPIARLFEGHVDALQIVARGSRLDYVIAH